jgi:hypothetical protein
MKNDCWVNGRLPENPELLAKVLGFTEQEVRDSLPAVMGFFAVSDGYIFCPELEAYKKELFEKKLTAKINGARGAAITNGKLRGGRKPKRRVNVSDDSDTAATPSATPSDIPQQHRQSKVGVLSSITSNSIKSNSVFKEEDSSDDWLTGYDSVPEQETVISNQEKVRMTV